MIITPILLGDNTVLKRFLAHPIFVPLARLSFSAYLVHLFLVYRNFFVLTYSYHFTILNGTVLAISNGAQAFFYGLILSLLLEVPIANIEAAFLSGGKKKPTHAKQAPAEVKVDKRKGDFIDINSDEAPKLDEVQNFKSSVSSIKSLRNDDNVESGFVSGEEVMTIKTEGNEDNEKEKIN